MDLLERITSSQTLTPGRPWSTPQTPYARQESCREPQKPLKTGGAIGMAGTAPQLLARRQLCAAPNWQGRHCCVTSMREAMVDFGIHLQSQDDPGAIEYFRKAALKKNVTRVEEVVAFGTAVSCRSQAKFTSSKCGLHVHKAGQLRKAFSLMADVFEQGDFLHRFATVPYPDFYAQFARGLLGIPPNPEEATKLRNFGFSSSSF